MTMRGRYLLMKKKRSAIALVGALTLAVSVTVGLVSGSVADAKKAKHKKGGGTVTVSKTTPTAIPASASGDAPDGSVSVPLVVGKKAKGKVVGLDALSITTSWTGSTGTALASVNARLTAPNGRTVGLSSPLFNMAAPTTPQPTSGPTTETLNSPVDACFPTTVPLRPCPGGNFRDPAATLGPPYVGTFGDPDLIVLAGVPAKGTWALTLLNSSTTSTATLNSVSLRLSLEVAPAA
jgi:hypothetical protein